MITGHQLRLRIKCSIRNEAAAIFNPLGEKLSRWHPTGRLLEYVYLKLFKRHLINQLQIISNASHPRPEDAAHIAFLKLELAEIEKVETGELSVDDYNRLCEIDSAWRGLASSRILIRSVQIKKQRRLGRRAL